MENSKQENSQPKIKCFKTIQMYFDMVGIRPELVTQSYPLNERIVIGFLMLSLTVTALCVYILNYAETLFEYTQSIYVGSAVVLFVLILVILVLKMDKFFECINNCDSQLNKSECFMSV